MNDCELGSTARERAEDVENTVFTTATMGGAVGGAVWAAGMAAVFGGPIAAAGVLGAVLGAGVMAVLGAHLFGPSWAGLLVPESADPAPAAGSADRLSPG